MMTDKVYYDKKDTNWFKLMQIELYLMRNNLRGYYYYYCWAVVYNLMEKFSP